jgi:DNA-binding MarR family transcriptional regulator
LQREAEGSVVEASLVARLLEQTARAVYGERGPKAVHPGQWAVLRFLACAGRDACTVGGVADHLGVTHAPASRAVAALARKKLVQVESDPRDRRVRRIQLSPAGRELLDSDPVHRLAQAIGELSEAERASLAAALQRIFTRLSGVDRRSRAA